MNVNDIKQAAQKMDDALLRHQLYRHSGLRRESESFIFLTLSTDTF